MKFIGITLGFIFCFYAGAFWQKWQLLESGAVELTKPLTLQSSPDAIGELPKGTILYPYSSTGSIETFVIFVNSKNLDLLKLHTFEQRLTVVPIDGYSE
ncbi:hypothetical protein [Shewanella sp. TC10]|uniref:hypothetical protein n=1 Tax=Shewanella sp. TC10 TaxID=1419739 RepID=UPI00129E2519|nr:hypothetical protein [Shewanella sp. TC10]